jgi:hypothetical protein
VSTTELVSYAFEGCALSQELVFDARACIIFQRDLPFVQRISSPGLELQPGLDISSKTLASHKCPEKHKSSVNKKYSRTKRKYGIDPIYSFETDIHILWEEE